MSRDTVNVDIATEIRTHSTDNDADRFEQRIVQMRQGLLDVLRRDAALDDDLLRRYGITAFDELPSEGRNGER